MQVWSDRVPRKMRAINVSLSHWWLTARVFRLTPLWRPRCLRTAWSREWHWLVFSLQIGDVRKLAGKV